MKLKTRRSVLIFLSSIVVLCATPFDAAAQSITSLSPTSGLVGSSITITGTGFGSTQGTSTVAFNGTAATTITSWSATQIVTQVPTGATTGNVVVAVGGVSSNGSGFAVLPSGWQDTDIGTVGAAGYASYSSGSFSITSSGEYSWSTSDGTNYLYQSLSGDGSIVARIASVSGGSSPQVGIMIRESLNANSANAYSAYQNYSGPIMNFFYRPSTSASTSVQTTGTMAIPYWAKLVRSGNTFSAYSSPDAVTWTQIGSSQTISMATNVDIGIAVSSNNTSTSVTAVLDNVSVSSSSAPAPVISSTSTTFGMVGSGVTISGTGFGASQGSSAVLLNDVPVTINSWSNTSITITVPTGATSGYLVVSVTPSMNDSNAVSFGVVTATVTYTGYDTNTQGSWHGVYGSDGYSVANDSQSIPSYASFAVQSQSNYTWASSTSDARALQNGSNTGRLAATWYNNSTFDFDVNFTDGNVHQIALYQLDWDSQGRAETLQVLDEGSGTVLDTRSISSFTGGIYLVWSVSGHIEITVTKTSGPNSVVSGVFFGLGTGGSGAPVAMISSLSPSSGLIGATATISGTGFGSSQGSSNILFFNNKTASVTSWSATSIVTTVPTGATTGNLVVTESGVDSNGVTFTVVPPPAITSLSRASGPPGTSVTINGTTFGSTQGTGTVTFNGTSATTITSWSDSQIVVQEPTGATTGNIIVTTSGGATSNGARFIVTGGYGYIRAITIPHALVPNTDQTDFPVLVSGTYSYLATTGNGGYVTSANGYDIIFTSDSAGSDVLPFEQESYSASTGAVTYWVQIPTLSHTADTTFYVFYGNSSIATDQSNPAEVWDSNYKGVWHLPNGSVLSANDSTSNGNNGTIHGTITAVSGQVDGAGSFDGSTGYISTTNTFSWPSNSTNEAWINTTSTSGQKATGLENNQTGTSSSEYDSNLYINTNGKAVATCYAGGDTTIISNSAVNDGNWHHLASTLNNSTNILTLYVDGVSQGTASCSGTASLTGYFRIGSYRLYGWPNSNDGYFNGKIDEVRLSNSVRSADWIATEYNNESNPTAFYGVEAAPSISSLSPTSGAVGVSVTITGSNFGATQGTSTVTFNGTAATPTSWSATSITVIVPSGTTTGNVLVNSSAWTSNGVSFTVLATPSISSLSTTSGAVGSSVTITGTNFGSTQGSSTVKFNGTTATASSWSSTSIVVSVPSGATAGNVVVFASGANTNGVAFTVTTSLTGYVTRQSDSTAINGATVQVLRLGSVLATATTASDGSYTISALGGGTYDVKFSASGFGSVLQAGESVPLTSTPTTLNQAMPTPGTISGQITQSNGTTAISGATVSALQSGETIGTATSDSSGNYSISILAAGSYEVEVSAAGYSTQGEEGVSVSGGSTTTENFRLNSAGTQAINYVYDQLGRLIGVIDLAGDSVVYAYDSVGNVLSIARGTTKQTSIVAMSPSSGPVGTAVTIYGTGFSTTTSSDSVSFNGTSATVSSATLSSLQVTVPSGATTGTVSVTTPNGSATSATSFVVGSGSSGPPTITSFSPTVGSPGTSVSVDGTDFSTSVPGDRLQFNQTLAAVTSPTSTALNTTVPANYGASGHLTISTSNGTAASSGDFFVPPPSYSASSVGFTGRVAMNGSLTATISTAYQIALIVFDGSAGQRISIDFTSETIGGFAPKIYTPTGATLYSAGSQGYIDVLTLPSTGTYTLVLVPYLSDTGSVTVNLYGITDVTGSITPGGSAVSVTTTAPGQNAKYTFSGTAGQTVFLVGSSTTYSYVNVSLIEPNGTTQAAGAATYYYPNCYLSDYSLTLPTTGTYTIFVDPSGDTTGGMTLTLYNPSNSSGPISINGSGVTFTPTVAQDAALTFSGTSGQQVTVHGSSNTITFHSIAIQSSDGTTTYASAGYGGSSFTTSSVTLPATGSYRIFLVPYRDSTGSVTITLTSP